MKIRPVGGELFHAGGRTDGQTQADMTKPIVALRNFSNVPKKAYRPEVVTGIWEGST
jgi:hypothetical protein